MDCGGEVIETRAKGVFRYQRITPTVGDNVSVNDGLIVSIGERTNLFQRPSIANVTLMAIVIAASPAPDMLLLDKQLAYSASVNVKSLIIMNKIDADDISKDIGLAYRYFEFAAVSAKTGEGIADLRNRLHGETVCFCGQSAVGKTSLINALFDLNMETGDLSKKTERGKHTTREVSLLNIGGALIADTPGFSVYSPNMKAGELKNYYPEFINAGCAFDDCMHIGEQGCAAVIDAARHRRYIRIYEALKEQEKYSK